MRKPYAFTTRDGRAGIVREARPGDARACLTITREAMEERPRTLAVTDGEFWTPRDWRKHRMPWGPDGATLVAEVGSRVVGNLAVHRGLRQVWRHAAEFGLTVASDSRGIGVGRALIEAAEAWAREQEVTRLTLSVFSHNERARRLYLGLGYVEEGTEHGALRFPEGEVDSIRMAKRLGGPGVPARRYDEAETGG